MTSATLTAFEGRYDAQRSISVDEPPCPWTPPPLAPSSSVIVSVTELGVPAVSCVSVAYCRAPVVGSVPSPTVIVSSSLSSSGHTKTRVVPVDWPRRITMF